MFEQWTNKHTGNDIEVVIYEDVLISSVEYLGDRYTQVIMRCNGRYIGTVSRRVNEWDSAALLASTVGYVHYNDCQKALEVLHEDKDWPYWAADLSIGVRMFERGLTGGAVRV